MMLHQSEGPFVLFDVCMVGQDLQETTHSWLVWYEREPPPLTAYVKRTPNINEADAYKWNIYT